MKQLAGAIRIGWVIEYKGKPWTVVKAMHIKPGKGPPVSIPAIP